MSLACTGVELGYPGRPRILVDVDVDLAPGRRVALLGPNGSGKTTLLRCLSGELAPLAGGVVVDGQVLSHRRRELAAHRRRVQLVRQDPDDQLFSADVTQDVSFGPLNLGLDEDRARERVAGTLDLLGISHLAGRPVHQLSYGERKRVAVAGAVAMRPGYLLLDEPTAGMDPDGIADMLTAIDRLEEHGTTVTMATHDVDLALAWADTVVVVHDGRASQGPSTDLLADEELLARAHLRLPWPLELWRRLGLAERAPDEVPPRSLDQVTAVLDRLIRP